MKPIPVNDLYASIQGEGVHAGLPVAFLRLQGCPVGCPWCDTKETWFASAESRVDSLADALGKNPRWAEVGPDVLALHALEILPPNRRLVVTGGEPCASDLAPFLDALWALDRDVRVCVETSGTIEAEWIFARPSPRLWVTLSPKIGMPGGLAVSPRFYSRADEIKWPVGRAADIENLERALGPELLSTPALRERVSLQPLSQSEKATSLCVDEARARGFRVSLQLHKYLDLP